METHADDAAWRELDDTVARADPDRYVAALFARARPRRGLIALYAFNHEVARIAEAVREPLAGHIRLGWWREQIDAIYEGRGGAMASPLSLALAETIRAHDLPRALFDDYLDARALDLMEAPFADEAALEAYAAATAGGLMKLGARVLGAGEGADEAAREAGIAMAYAGFVRSLAFDAARRHCRLPLAWLEAERLNAEDVFARAPSDGLRRVISRLAEAARRRLAQARRHKLPSAAMPVLAPAVLADAYLKKAEDRDPLNESIAIGAAERVRRIAMAMLRRRI